MSELSEKVRIALDGKLNVSSVTDLATGGVHYQDVPEGTATPYVVFTRIPGKVARSVFGSHLLEDDIWRIKAVTELTTSGAKSPQKLGEEIVQACSTAIGTTLTIAGGTVVYMQRENDIVPYKEPVVNDRHIYHTGFDERIQVESTS